MRIPCRRSELLIAGQKSGISEAEGLLLAAHLAECERCAQVAHVLRRVEGLVAEGTKSVLSVQARDRALQKALIQAQIPRSTRPAPSRMRRIAFALAVTAAAIAAVFVAQSLRPGSEARDRVLAGTLTSGGRSLIAGTALSSSPMIAGREGATIAVAHAEVQVEPSGEIAWDAERTTLLVRARAVDVAVDPRPHRAFRVATPRFVVDVLGTRFRVDARSVLVREGTVRIRDPEGRVLVDHLAAGGAFNVPPQNEVVRTESEHASAPPPSDGKRAPVRSPEPRHHQRRDERARGASVDPPLELLRKARHALAERDVSAARALIDTARRARAITREEEAEADTLYAQCATVEGDRAEAERRFEAIATRYPDLSAGESALFAAARLAFELNQRPKAKELFLAYLKRHPDGRFHTEASARLQALSNEGDR